MFRLINMQLLFGCRDFLLRYFFLCGVRPLNAKQVKWYNMQHSTHTTRNLHWRQCEACTKLTLSLRLMKENGCSVSPDWKLDVHNQSLTSLSYRSQKRTSWDESLQTNIRGRCQIGGSSFQYMVLFISIMLFYIYFVYAVLYIFLDFLIFFETAEYLMTEH